MNDSMEFAQLAKLTVKVLAFLVAGLITSSWLVT